MSVRCDTSSTMDYRALTLDDRAEWSRLLAVSFDRTSEQMGLLLDWFHAGFELVTWGAWDGDSLVAQYNCRLLQLQIPGRAEPALAGMGLNMAVDPAYRGRGLLDTVAGPVHEMITARGCIAGVGFSSEGGLEVTRKSSSYAYHVLGPMVSSVVVLMGRHDGGMLRLTDDWPDGHLVVPPPDPRFVRYTVTADSIRHRFAEHPFRRYRFGSWHEGNTIRGVVVYRPVRLRGLPGVALLAAYGDDMPALLSSWAGAIQRTGVRLVHIVTSPASPLRDAVREIGLRWTVPRSRHPYHLIARSLRDDCPPVIHELGRWDCTGGDIL
jgi:GNAT superfamily N-acetyltransferase